MSLIKKVSLIGVIVGAIVNVVGSNIWGLIVGLYILSAHNLYSLPRQEQTAQMMQIFQHNPFVFVVNAIVGSAFSILGGYIAARIAKRNEILNGGLSSFLCILVTLSVITTAPIFEIVAGLIGNPLLGMLGGYLYLRFKQKASII